MPNIQSHRDLVVWQKSMELAELIYHLAERFPKKEIYGLVSQMTRAAVSVPSNIAEGQARGTSKDYSYFLSVSKGSLMELETLLMLSVRIKFLFSEEAQPAFDLITEISKMLTSLRSKLMLRG
jgi:four helix bundle protein